MNGDPLVYETLQRLNIPFDYYEHPEAPTVEIASQYWKDIASAHCKNLFFRNHKGNRHYLVIFHYQYILQIKDLEARLRQGKLSFASEERMMEYLGLKPGSVSPFGLLYDTTHHTHLFIDAKLQDYDRISFHPNLNTASIVIAFSDFNKYLQFTGNTFEFIRLYDD